MRFAYIRRRLSPIVLSFVSIQKQLNAASMVPPANHSELFLSKARSEHSEARVDACYSGCPAQPSPCKPSAMGQRLQGSATELFENLRVSI